MISADESDGASPTKRSRLIVLAGPTAVGKGTVRVRGKITNPPGNGMDRIMVMLVPRESTVFMMERNLAGPARPNGTFEIRGGFADVTPEGLTVLAEHAVETEAA